MDNCLASSGHALAPFLSSRFRLCAKTRVQGKVLIAGFAGVGLALLVLQRKPYARLMCRLQEHR
jgi:hypothetical protein